MGLNVRTMSGEELNVREVRLYPRALLSYADQLRSEVEEARKGWLVLGTPMALISAEIAKALMDRTMSSDVRGKLLRLDEVARAIIERARWVDVGRVRLSGANGLRDAEASGPSIDLEALFPIPKPSYWTASAWKKRRYKKQVAARASLPGTNLYVALPGAEFIEVRVDGAETTVSHRSIEAVRRTA